MNQESARQGKVAFQMVRSQSVGPVDVGAVGSIVAWVLGLIVLVVVVLVRVRRPGKGCILGLVVRSLVEHFNIRSTINDQCVHVEHETSAGQIVQQTLLLVRHLLLALRVGRVGLLFQLVQFGLGLAQSVVLVVTVGTVHLIIAKLLKVDAFQQGLTTGVLASTTGGESSRVGWNSDLGALDEGDQSQCEKGGEVHFWF